MRKSNQVQRMLRHMREYGSITSIEAMQEYGIARAASRIHDIKQLGYDVVTTTKTKHNRYGERVHYARYSLREEARQ